jgi:hypothetical protein
MKVIASRLAYDISTMDNQKMENYLVQENQKACKANDHDAIIGSDYLRKLNVCMNSCFILFIGIYLFSVFFYIMVIYHFDNVWNDLKRF